MCPNCNRGLVNGELCTQCAGTGFWNPLSAKEVVHEPAATVSEDSGVGKIIAVVKKKVGRPKK